MNESTPKNNFVNISYYLKDMASKRPYKRAVVFPSGRDKAGRVTYAHLTFLQLDQESDLIASGLENFGIVKGTRTILMVRPSLEFFALTFALFKTGAVPVVVDPGMGLKRMLGCMEEGDPEAFIGIPLAHMVRTIFPGYFKSVKKFVTVGKRLFWGGTTLERVKKNGVLPYTTAKTRADNMAAILFTSGSTGPAKGVVYNHGTFDAQIRQIKSHFDIAGDEVDLPTFPLFALFDPALGMTAIIPDMDPTKPAFVNPLKIIEAIKNQGVTNMFASPALLNRVGRYGKKNHIKLPSLKRVISAGAPVSPSNIEQFSSMFASHALLHTPYGATEAVPIVSIDSNEILSETRMLTEKGYGNCVGRPINNTDVRLIKITDDPINKWSEDLVVPQGETGEIVVKAELVSKEYYNKPRYNALHKIHDHGEIWHRMGDLGWMDKKGRIWMCGRKTHRVVTGKGPLFSIPCEAIFNNHPMVFRSALVGIGEPGRQKPVICVELEKKVSSRKKIIERELLALARKNSITNEIDTILFHKSFPVDIRHNSKIFREKLSQWAASQLEKR